MNKNKSMNMKPLSLDTITAITGGEYRGSQELRAKTITGVVRDNREVQPGYLFICIIGERVDGHDFANKAFEAGALCALAEHELIDSKGPYILVDSTLNALKKLAGYYRSLFNIPVIGITGSVGKTTAKEMTACVLSGKYNVLKTYENLNNEIGVPLMLLSLREEHEAAVIEMGISDFGEMRRLAQMVKPDICLITTIGYCHLDNLGDLSGVLKAKSEVFEFMKSDSLAVVNGDDELLRAFDPGIRKLSFGLGDYNDFKADNIESFGTEGIKADIVYSSGLFNVFIPAFGSHMVLGALPAVAIGLFLGLAEDEIRKGLSTYMTVGGRANIKNNGFITLIDDCYNANPNSVKASIASLCSLDGRKVAILGDMKELGSKSDELHREIGQYAAVTGVDLLICCGSSAEYIYRGFISNKNSSDSCYFSNKDELYSWLPVLIKAGDNVLVKASHSMRFEDITKELIDLIL